MRGQVKIAILACVRKRTFICDYRGLAISRTCESFPQLKFYHLVLC